MLEVERLTIIVPKAMMERIDNALREIGETTRSRFIREAIREKLEARAHLHAIVVPQEAPGK